MVLVFNVRLWSFTFTGQIEVCRVP